MALAELDNRHQPPISLIPILITGIKPHAVHHDTPAPVVMSWKSSLSALDRYTAIQNLYVRGTTQPSLTIQPGFPLL